MSDVAQVLRKACANHPDRESVGRCPECTHTFCRECITDHEGRVICANCLAMLQTAATERSGVILAFVKGTLGTVVGLLLALAFFYGLGWGLLAIPDSFHKGTWYAIGEE